MTGGVSDAAADGGGVGEGVVVAGGDDFEPLSRVVGLGARGREGFLIGVEDRGSFLDRSWVGGGDVEGVSWS